MVLCNVSHTNISIAKLWNISSEHEVMPSFPPKYIFCCFHITYMGMYGIFILSRLFVTQINLGNQFAKKDRAGIEITKLFNTQFGLAWNLSSSCMLKCQYLLAS